MNLGENKALVASAARTATHSTEEQDSAGAVGLYVYVDVTAIDASPSVVATIQGRDPATNNWATVATFTAFTSVSAPVFLIYPGVLDADTAAEAKSVTLPRKYRLTFTHADADSITYSVGVTELN